MKKYILVAIYIIISCLHISCKTNVSKPDQIDKNPIKSKPNIIIIVVDTLRKDHVGCYGYKRDTTPNIDAFSKDALIFNDLVATSSWTIPSVMSLFTGLYPAKHQVVDFESKLSEKIPTLASILKNNNYQTVGIVTNPSVHSMFGFDTGFDDYNDNSYRIENEMKILSAGGKKIEPHAYVTSPILTRHAIKWLDKKRVESKPFFMYLHYNDPHYSYIPPMDFSTMFDPDYRGEMNGYDIPRNPLIKKGMPQKDLNHLVALYDGEIRWTDEYIGRFLERVKKLDLYKKTMILVIGDHGEEFLERGFVSHGKTLYSEVINIPAVLKLPEKPNVEISNPDLCSIADIMPTILDIAGAEYDENSLDGISLISQNKDKIDKRVAIPFETHSYSQMLIGILTRKYKIIFALDKNIQEAYNIKDDPLENTKLDINGNEDIKDILKTIGIQYIKQIRSHSSSNEPLVKDKKTLEMLKSLGYVQE